mgnify:CR=1 FL=1
MPQKTRVAVLGLSVSADQGGFVDRGRRDPEIGRTFDLRKVALGGVNLRGLQFLLPEVFDGQETDLVVLEIATNAFRGRTEPKWYRTAFRNVVAFFEARDIRVAILDLPRFDIDPEADWMADFHRQYCTREGFPYLKVDLRADLLRDGVHATSEGHIQYARELVRLLEIADKIDTGAGPVTVFQPGFPVFWAAN